MKPKLPIIKIWLVFVFLSSASGTLKGSRIEATAHNSQRGETGLAAENRQLTEDWPPGEMIQTKLTAPDAEGGEFFGNSVAAESGMVIVGAPWDYAGPKNDYSFAGSVYIFKRNLGHKNWNPVTRLTAGDPDNSAHFGTSIAIDGNTLVVGAFNTNVDVGGSTIRAGAAYVFERNGSGNWQQTAKLSASDAQAQDAFGSVAVSGDTIVVGAFREDGGPGDPVFDGGAAYVFERNQGGPGNWGETRRLSVEEVQDEDSFGRSVAIHDDTIVIGGEREDGGESDPLDNTGAAYIFERNQDGPGAWGLVLKLTPSNAEENGYFGSAVAVEGDTMIVGAMNKNSSYGGVYIFYRNQGGQGAWGEVTEIVAEEATPSGDQFGTSVAISGDLVVVGAWLDGGEPGNPGDEKGAAYIFDRNLGGIDNWGQIQKFTAADTQPYDYFGGAVDVAGSTVVVGAFGEDGGPNDPHTDAGAAYVYWGVVTGYMPGILSP